MKANTLTPTPTQTRCLAKAWRASLRKQITIPTLAAACQASRKAVARPSNAALIDYLAENDWVIDDEQQGDDILCHKGAYTMHRQDEQWTLTQHTDNRARILKWKTTFTNAPDAVIIATLNALVASQKP